MAGGLLASGQYFFDFYEKAIASNFQAKLLALQLNEVERLAKFFQEKPITLLFAGDIMLSRGVANQIKKHQDVRWPFLKIATTTREADLTFGNLEGPISDRGENQGSIYSFRSSPEVIEGLSFAGFDVLSLANNHIWDWGKDALIDTITMLEHSGLKGVGAGENYQEANAPVIKEIGSTGSSQVKVAFLAYTDLYPKSLEAHSTSSGQATPGISSFELEKAKTDIQQLKSLKLADIIVVSFHWGEEYKTEANESQKRIARELIDAGADLIIGHHSHVVQEIEQYQNGWIAYSLGNFIFDQNFSKETVEGLMLEVVIKNKKISEVSPIKIKINSAFQPEVINL